MRSAGSPAAGEPRLTARALPREPIIVAIGSRSGPARPGAALEAQAGRIPSCSSEVLCVSASPRPHHAWKRWSRSAGLSCPTEAPRWTRYALAARCSVEHGSAERATNLGRGP